MKTLISGATGLIGQQLVKRIENPVVLSRNPSRAQTHLGQIDAYPWEPSQSIPPLAAFEEVDVVFALAGESVVGGRWTAAKKQRIHDSRVLGMKNMVTGMKGLDKKPSVLVSASAIGFYGDRGDECLDEDSTAGTGFLADICRKWEHEALKAAALGIRVVCLRIGIVLSKEGGALGQMLPIFKMGLGGNLGNGRQWMSWIHIEDVVNLLLHASENNTLNGVVNATAPNPATNAQFTKALSHAIRRPAFLPVPRFGLSLAFGEMSNAVTASQRVLPKRALKAGFQFQQPDLNSAMKSIFHPNRMP